MNQKTKFGVAIFLSLAASLIATDAWASCTQAEAAGKYNFYGFLADPGDGWIRCSLNIDSIGNVGAGTCFEADGGKATITSGSIKVQRSCVVTGFISASGAPIEIKHATFSRDKFHFSGIGEATIDLPTEGPLAPAIFEAVKL